MSLRLIRRILVWFRDGSTYETGRHLCQNCLDVYDERFGHFCSQQVFGYCMRCRTARPLDRPAECRSCGEHVAHCKGVWERMRKNESSVVVLPFPQRAGDGPKGAA